MGQRRRAPVATRWGQALQSAKGPFLHVLSAGSAQHILYMMLCLTLHQTDRFVGNIMPFTVSEGN